MDKEQKTGLINTYRRHPSDTGSPEVQIAILSGRITHLTEHLQTHKHDQSFAERSSEDGRAEAPAFELPEDERS